MASIAQENSLFEIDRELDTLLDEIEEEFENRGEASAELMERFQRFCEARWAQPWQLPGWPNRFSEQGTDFGALSAHPARRTLWTLTRKRLAKADAGSGYKLVIGSDFVAEATFGFRDSFNPGLHCSDCPP